MFRAGYQKKWGKSLTDKLGWISDITVPCSSFIRARNIISAKSYVCFVGLPYCTCGYGAPVRAWMNHQFRGPPKKKVKEREKKEGQQRTLNTAWNASRKAPCPRRGRGNSARHKRSGLQKMSSTGVAPSSGRRRSIIPRDCMTSTTSWISSAQLRGSWNTKTADIGVVEKSMACGPR